MRKLFIIIPVVVLLLAVLLTFVLVSCNKKTVEVAELSAESISSVEESVSSEEVTSLEESSEADSSETAGSKNVPSMAVSKAASKAQSVAPSSSSTAQQSSVAPKPTLRTDKQVFDWLIPEAAKLGFSVSTGGISDHNLTLINGARRMEIKGGFDNETFMCTLVDSRGTDLLPARASDLLPLLRVLE